MPTRPSLALCAILLLAMPALAAECPVKRSGDAISTALEKAATCEAALKLFKDCAYVASIDAMFGGIVTTRCEADFLSKLSAAQRKSYDREKNACTRKYTNKEGTMYRSFEAMCYSELAARYSKSFAGK